MTSSTWSALIASGVARVGYLLEIAGFRYVLGTVTYTETASWYTSEGYEGIKDWLEFEIPDYDEVIDHMSGFLRVRDLTVSVTDHAGDMMAEVKSREELSPTPITATVTAAATTISVADISGYATNDVAAIGQERFLIGGLATNSFTSCTRGYLGTTALGHILDTTTIPERRPMVTTGPVRLAGRPCRLRAVLINEATGEPFSGTISGEDAAQVIYRGVIGDEIKVFPERWEIPILHISTVMSREVGRGLPASAIDPYHYCYSGESYPSLSTVRYILRNTSGGGLSYDVTLTGSPAILTSVAHLCTNWSAASLATGGAIKPTVGEDAEGKVRLFCEDNATNYVEISVREGDPLWAMGFEPGTITQEVNTELDVTATDNPRAWVCELSDTGAGSPRIFVEDETVFETDLWVALPNGPVAVVEATTGGYVDLVPGMTDAIRPQLRFAAVEADKQEDLILRHAFVFSPHYAGWIDSVKRAMQRSMGQLAGQSEPDEWCLPLITSADVDWDEADDALAGVPGAVALYTGVVLEPTEWQELFGPHLGLLGVAPRITDEGKIGWCRLETPTALRASTIELDEDVWDLLNAAGIQATIGGPLTTGVELHYGHDYRDDSWPQPSKIKWHDWAAEAGQERDEVYKLRGVCTSTGIIGMAANRSELDLTIANMITPTHFGLFGRDAVEVEIPVTFTGWQIRCGDVVKVTHSMVPDVCTGTLGVTERLGLVVGRRLPLTREGTGSLLVRIAPDVNASGISPCALGTSWDSGTKKITFDGCAGPVYAQAGANDLDAIDEVVTAEGSTVVQFWEYDVASPTAGYPVEGTVVAVDVTNKTVTLSADIFTALGGFPTDGVEMTWPDWDSQNTSQKVWLANAGTDYTLGASGNDDAYVWGI